MVRRSRIVAFLISLALLALEIFWLFLKGINNKMIMYSLFINQNSHFNPIKITLTQVTSISRRNSVWSWHSILGDFFSIFFKSTTKTLCIKSIFIYTNYLVQYFSINQCLPVNVHSSFVSIAELEGVGFNESLLKSKHPWLPVYI